MKLRWVWMLAIAVVCLLWSLNRAASLDKHLVAWSRESCSPSSCPSLPVLSQDCIRRREGPQRLFLTPDVLLRTEDLGPKGPPWLESRGPPGKHRAPGQPGGSLVALATAALQRGVNYPKLPRPGEFFRPPGRGNQIPDFCNSL
jgi:hypothetical protein